jgi:alpha-L-fucosidase 2
MPRPGLARTAGFLVAALALCAPAFAQPCPALNVGNPDGNYIVPGVLGDIRYSGERALDAFVQPGSLRPSVIVVHGGGWTAGSRAAHVGQLLETLTAAGYNWFSVDYGLGGLKGIEGSLADVRSALAFIRCHAGELKIDAGRLVLLGEDTGAQLSALLAAERSDGVIGAVLVGGVYDLPATAATAGLDAAAIARASPLTRIAPGMPPVLLVHGTADTEVPIDHAQGYCAALQAAKGRCRLIAVNGASHRSENWWPDQWTYKREMVAWLKSIAPVPPVASETPRTRLQKNIVFSESPLLKLDAFIPAATRPSPAVVIVHGGGWEAGDKVTYVTPLFEPLARAGLAWFSIDYRLTPAVTHQDQLADIRKAIAFIRSQHARFNIDPARIILVGESASGQMVSLLATEDTALAGVISFYGVYDLPAMVTDTSPRSLLVRLFRRDTLDEESQKVLREFSPLHKAHRGMPPLLLINGTGERLWAQAQAFARRLAELGANHQVIALEGAPHGLENWEGHPGWVTYKRQMIDWIRQSLIPNR